jgi:hypothetical protein
LGRAHALDFAPEQGEAVLSALSEQYDGVAGFNAEMTLDVWRQGELRFPQSSGSFIEL